MQLKYRGIAYSHSTESIETTERSVFGTYRGQPMTFQVAQPQPVRGLAGEELTYRGVRYVPGQDPLSEQVIHERVLRSWRRNRSTRLSW